MGKPRRDRQGRVATRLGASWCNCLRKRQHKHIPYGQVKVGLSWCEYCDANITYPQNAISNTRVRRSAKEGIKKQLEDMECQ